MDEQNNLSSWLKRTQEALAGLITLITSVATLIITMRGEPSLYKLLIAVGIFSALFVMCAYVAFSKTKPIILGGRGIYRFERYRVAALIGMGIIVGIIVAFASLRSNRILVASALSGDMSFIGGDTSREQICNQISIAPEVKRLNMIAPLAEDSYAGVNYEFTGPPGTGVQVLFHKAQHLIYDGARDVEIVMGKHFTHENVYIPAGQSVLLPDGILLGKYDVESATKYKTALITQRLTFSVVTDQGTYCEIGTDLEIEMTGLAP